MTTEGKVSPLPWVCERTLVVNGLGYEVSLYEHRHEIVRAVNAHDRLVDAIERYVTTSDAESFAGLRAALAAAKEG